MRSLSPTSPSVQSSAVYTELNQFYAIIELISESRAMLAQAQALRDQDRRNGVIQTIQGYVAMAEERIDALFDRPGLRRRCLDLELQIDTLVREATEAAWALAERGERSGQVIEASARFRMAVAQ